MSAEKGPYERTEEPDTLGAEPYRLLLSEKQVAAGKEILEAHTK